MVTGTATRAISVALDGTVSVMLFPVPVVSAAAPTVPIATSTGTTTSDRKSLPNM